MVINGKDIPRGGIANLFVVKCTYKIINWICPNEAFPQINIFHPFGQE
jgi:hypothetical protein